MSATGGPGREWLPLFLRGSAAGQHGRSLTSGLLQVEPHVQRWTTTAWTSSWAAARGQTHTCPSAPLPWLAVLVSAPPQAKCGDSQPARSTRVLAPGELGSLDGVCVFRSLRTFCFLTVEVVHSFAFSLMGAAQM